MCFSPQASFIAAAGLAVIGIATFSRSRSFSVGMFAIIPLIFALQQALEGAVWITLLRGDEVSHLYKFSVYGYLFFAGIFWPLWIPICLLFLEKNIIRKVFLFIVLLFGIIAASKFLFQLISHHVTAHIAHHHIVYPIMASTYRSSSFYSLFYFQKIDMLFSFAYLSAVIVPFFISSIKKMWLVGLGLAIAFIISELAYAYAFGSVWCFLAAVGSLVTYYFVVKLKNY